MRFDHRKACRRLVELQSPRNPCRVHVVVRGVRFHHRKVGQMLGESVLITSNRVGSLQNFGDRIGSKESLLEASRWLECPF